MARLAAKNSCLCTGSSNWKSNGSYHMYGSVVLLRPWVSFNVLDLWWGKVDFGSVIYMLSNYFASLSIITLIIVTRTSKSVETTQMNKKFETLLRCSIKPNIETYCIKSSGIFLPFSWRFRNSKSGLAESINRIAWTPNKMQMKQLTM